MESNKPPRVRFAPSPTGDLHLGSVRTLLYNALFAQHHGGTFIIRLEDTDQERYIAGSEQRIIDALEWLGVRPDEGFGSVGDKGDFGPYVQSERRAIYQKYVDQLVEEGKAYYCFATKEELDEMRAAQVAEHQPPRYDGRYRDFDIAEAKERVTAGEKHVIRLKLPESGEVTGHDAVYGDVKFDYKEYDDHVIMKSDGLPTYHFASVVDDHLMEISHVFRGEEWLPSWPRHIATYEAFGWDMPTFVHLPLIFGSDHQKLSKRHGAKTLLQYRDEGYLPEALINYVVFVGWNPKTTQEFFLWDELADAFDIKGINKSNPIFDPVRLDFMNGRYLRQLTADDVIVRIHDQLEVAKIPADERPDQVALAIATVLERAKTLSEIPEYIAFYFQAPEYDKQLLLWKEQTAADCARLLEYTSGGLAEVKEWTPNQIQEEMMARIHHADVSNGEVLWPLRVALSGSKASPGPFDIAHVLGQAETLARVKAAIKKLA